MEIKDKKLVGILVSIIIILLIALGALYFSTPQGGPQGDRPKMPANMQQNNTSTKSTGTDSTGTKNSANSSKNSTSTTENGSEGSAASSSTTTD